MFPHWISYFQIKDKIGLIHLKLGIAQNVENHYEIIVKKDYQKILHIWDVYKK